MTTTKKRVKFPMHKRLMAIAKAEVKRHIVNDEGEKCFNLFTYLQSLESTLDGLFHGRELPHGDFDLNSHTVARYLWVCLALEEGEAAYGDTFRDMPMLD